MLHTKQVENAKSKEKCYRLFDGQGLYLEIAPNGSKYWRFKYFYSGKEKRLAIGKFPDLSLLEAREQREKARKILANGDDPSAAKQERKRQAIQNAAITFEVVAREWHECFKERWSPEYTVDTMHRLQRDIFPFIGNSPVADLVAPDLPAVLAAHQAKEEFLSIWKTAQPL